MGDDAEYWGGATWVYHASITNDAMDAATQTYTIVPGTGNEMEILYGQLFNGDTVARSIVVSIEDNGNELARLIALAAAAASFHSFPASDDPAVASTDLSAGARLILSGNMALVGLVASVAVSQDSLFGVVARIRGGLPTVTEAASAGTPVISINTEQVF